MNAGTQLFYSLSPVAAIQRIQELEQDCQNYMDRLDELSKLNADLLHACERQLEEHNRRDELGICGCRGCDLARRAIRNAKAVKA